ncbi:MAG: insulinase family protein, partial [Gammaproteobacteria bacterium]|nr:insulinase family protein [Gammaproteobacteria bacterium]
VSKKGDEIVIPYEKYKLDNGLTVILHQDKSDPLVHVDVTYHVGSAREDIGKSGFAHFFEHMQFQGSENVADEEHFKIVSESGGTLNGSTNGDRTNYYQTVPSNQLEKMLWLESDRMGYFLDAVTQEKFEVQRETVKNERGQRYDNRPYGLLWEKIGEAMYPEGHPYSWTTIGYLEDLDRANLFDLKKFFLRWYGPNNATLTIGGDLDVQQTLQWVVDYFADIPAGPEVDMPKPQPGKLEADRYISYEDNISLPLIYFSFPTVSARHTDEAPLDVLANILGGGKTSLLYKNLVKNGLAVQANASHPCSELACALSLLALPNPASGKNLSDLDSIIRESLAEFETRGVNDDDLQRVKASIVSGMIYGLESVAGKVSQLAAYETYTNNPDYIKQDLERYQNVSKDDVLRVYKQYIKNKPAVILSIVQKGKPDTVAKPDTYVHQARTIPKSENTKESDLEYRVPNSRVDRSKRPVASGNPSVSLPKLQRGKLENGIALLSAANDEVPTTAISFRINSGHRDDPLDKVGLASFTASMLNEATTESSNEELSNRLQKLGSSVNIFAGTDYTTVSIKSLTENLDETLDIAAEKLFQPAFAEADFKRVKDQTLESIEQGKKQAAQTASNVNRHILYGKSNSLAFPAIGITKSVENISLADVKNFYAMRFSPKIADIIAVSDLSQKELIAKLSVFAKWQGGDVPVTALKPFPDYDKSSIYFVDKPAAAQSEIRLAKRALPYDATGEYYRAGLMNYALGGAFNSRININLREDKGYTYGARSGFNGSKEYGSFSAGAGVRADATAASLTEFINEISDYHADGITADELEFTKNSIGQRDARSYETPSQKLRFLSRIQTYNLQDDFVDQQKEILENLTEEEVDALANKHLNLDEMNIVIVGDKANVMEELKAFGYPIVEVDAEANPL